MSGQNRGHWQDLILLPPDKLVHSLGSLLLGLCGGIISTHHPLLAAEFAGDVLWHVGRERLVAGKVFEFWDAPLFIVVIVTRKDG
jgi:hypothetical protein